MKYFITGHTGFIGKNICEKIVSGGDELVTFKKDTKLEIPDDVDSVIHLAAEIYNESEMFDSNILLTYNILEMCKNKKIKSFIYIGSSSEYGLCDDPMEENMLLKPRNIYEATKACGSLLTQSYSRQYNLPSVIIRPFSVYGKYEGKHRLIPTIFRSIKTGDNIKITPGVHDFIYIKDLVESVFHINNRIINSPFDIVDIINIGSGKQFSNIQMVEIIEKVTNKKINYTMVPEKMRSFDTVGKWICNNNKLVNLYEYDIKYTLEKGIYDTYYT